MPSAKPCKHTHSPWLMWFCHGMIDILCPPSSNLVQCGDFRKVPVSLCFRERGWRVAPRYCAILDRSHNWLIWYIQLWHLSIVWVQFMLSMFSRARFNSKTSMNYFFSSAHTAILNIHNILHMRVKCHSFLLYVYTGCFQTSYSLPVRVDTARARYFAKVTSPALHPVYI